MIAMWTPEPDGQLKDELTAALARPNASWVSPPRPVALTKEVRATGWLWGRLLTPEGTWLGLATIFRGRFFEGAELGWHPAEDLRTLT